MLKDNLIKSFAACVRYVYHLWAVGRTIVTYWSTVQETGR